MCLIRRLFYIIVVIQRVVEPLRSLLIITMLVTTWLTSWTLTATFMTLITTTEQYAVVLEPQKRKGRFTVILNIVPWDRLPHYWQHSKLERFT